MDAIPRANPAWGFLEVAGGEPGGAGGHEGVSCPQSTLRTVYVCLSVLTYTMQLTLTHALVLNVNSQGSQARSAGFNWLMEILLGAFISCE